MSSIDPKRVAARVAGRAAASEVIDLLSWPDGYGADYADAFVEVIRAMMPMRQDKIVEPPKLTPIARLGATKIEFGLHAGKSLDDIPLEYLDWLCRANESLTREIKEYLQHPELEGRRR